LLNSFEEKEKKDYYKGISIAYKRIKSIKWNLLEGEYYDR
jgi:hypothetical protein